MDSYFRSRAFASPAFAFLALAMLIPASAFAQDLPDPQDLRDPQDSKVQTLLLAPDQVFSPTGFDDNDNAQLVIAGTFPDTCYNTGPAGARVDRDKKEILIRNTAYYFPGCFCIQVGVPFFSTIDLGPLPAGDYQIRYETATSPRDAGAIRIAESPSPDQDNHLYASVDEVSYVAARGDSPAQIHLKGEFPADCLVLKEVKLIHSDPQILEILPVAEKTIGNCAIEPVPFEATLSLKDHPLRGKALIHVRSLNGKAINRALEIR